MSLPASRPFISCFMFFCTCIATDLSVHADLHPEAQLLGVPGLGATGSGSWLFPVIWWFLFIAPTYIARLHVLPLVLFTAA